MFFPLFLLPSLTAHRPAHSALESTLLSVLSALEAEMVFIRNLVGGLLAELEELRVQIDMVRHTFLSIHKP